MTAESKDIFADWKTNRFVIANDTARDYLSIEEDRSTTHIIILTDFKFWTENMDDLSMWCEQHRLQYGGGMILDIPDDRTLTLFILRWS